MNDELWGRLSSAVREIPSPQDDTSIEVSAHLESDQEVAAFQAFLDLANSSEHGLPVVSARVSCLNSTETAG